MDLNEREEELRDAVIDIMQEGAPVKTAGAVKQQLQQRGVVEQIDRPATKTLLENMRADDILEYSHGEYGEFTLKE